MARSGEINSAVVLLGTFFTLYLLLPYLWQGWEAFTVKLLSSCAHSTVDLPFTNALMLEGLLVTAKMVLPVVGVAFAAGLMASLLQVGLVFSGEGLSLKLSRLNPVEGFQRIFSKRALVELFKSAWKVAAVGYIAYSTVRGQMFIFPQLMDTGFLNAISLVNRMVFDIAWKVGLLLLVLAAIDYFYQWWELEKSLMMSKPEVKEEYKQTEGDPQVKARIKEQQRRAAMRRMMARIPQADVVITNPTHFAVALSYQPQKMAAPMVVAKGQDLVALKIRELARQHGVAVVEDPPLARTLYQTVEIGDLVPPELYQAVAEVLAFVYRLRRKAY